MVNHSARYLNNLFLRLRYALAGSPPLLVLHLQETGLREQVEPIIHWLLTNDQCWVLLVVRTAQRDAYLRDSTLPLTQNRRLSLITEEDFIARLWPADAVLSLHPESPSSVAKAYSCCGPFRIVMQHGLPDKESFFVSDGRGDTLSCYDGLFLFGPSSREGTLRLYAEHYPEQFHRLRLFNIGYPKTDALLMNKFDRAGFLYEQGLNPERRTICYAPTYQRTASLEQQGIEIIRTLASLDANVLVKLHHVSMKPPGPELEKWVIAETGGKNWRDILDELEQGLPNVRLARVHNANPCLLASDVLVTDVSGVAFEFLLLDRPVIFIDVPQLFSVYGTTGIHYWGRRCGEIVSTTDELKKSVSASLIDSSRGRDLRIQLLKSLVYNPGQATEKAGQTIQEILRGQCE